jgi:RNA polymerase sigma-70 factor (ECF subfamily)
VNPEREPLSNAFVTTQWTRVLEARGNSSDSQAALSDLCAAYYAPVFAFIRRCARDDEKARDLTQEFFSRLIAKRGLANLERDRGRFRSFLLGAVKHFLSDIHDRDFAAKRGSGETPLPLLTETDTSVGLQVPDPSAPSAEKLFDRQWAMTVLARALNILATEQSAAGKGEQFNVLKPWLTGDNEHLSQSEAAGQLGLNEGAVKVAIHRLRKQFRELVKAEIAGTVETPAEIQDELRYLIEVLA